MASSPGSQSSQNSCDVCSAPVQINSHQGWTVVGVRYRRGNFISSVREASRGRRQVCTLLQVVITGDVAHSAGQAQCLQQASDVGKLFQCWITYSPPPVRMRARGGTCSKVIPGILVCSAPAARSSETLLSICSSSADLNMSLLRMLRLALQNGSEKKKKKKDFTCNKTDHMCQDIKCPDKALVSMSHSELRGSAAARGRRVCYGRKRGLGAREPSHGDGASEVLRERCTQI